MVIRMRGKRNLNLGGKIIGDMNPYRHKYEVTPQGAVDPGGHILELSMGWLKDRIYGNQESESGVCVICHI